MNATRRDLEIQFRRVIDNKWLPIFQREAKRAGITTVRLLGIGSRETNLKNIRGDFRGGIYHGYGILQVDIGTNPAYCRAWTPDNEEGSIVGGVTIYLSKVADTKAYVGKKCSVKGHIFTGKAIEPDDLHRIATAAYNCGRWAYYHFSRGENVDSTTTGHDYSRDVYDRAVEFADMLEKGGHETNAVAIELDAQGKYASRATQNRFQHFVIDDRLKTPVAAPQEAEDELAGADYGRDETDEQLSATVPATPPTAAELSATSEAIDSANVITPATPEPPLNPSDANTTVKETTVESPTGTTVATTTANIQDVNETATVATAQYQGVGLMGVLKKDFAAVGGGNVSFQTLQEYATEASGWPAWVVALITKLATIAIVLGAAWLVYRLIHYVIWRIGDWHRQRLEAEINTDVNRKNLEFN